MLQQKHKNKLKKPDLREEIEQKKAARRESQERQDRERQKREKQNKIREKKRKASQERNEGYSTAVKGKRTTGVQIKNRTEEESHYSTDEEPKPQRKTSIRNRKETQSNDGQMSKMAMVICHAHFHRIANGGSYTRIFKRVVCKEQSTLCHTS